MSDLLEERLRRALRDGEADEVASPDLAARAAALGRQSLRRRRAAAVVGAVAAVLVVVGTTLGVAHLRDDTRPVAPGAEGESGPLLRGEWAAGLPRGAAPSVAYVGGTTVFFADGEEVRLRGYTDLAMVGPTVSGVVVSGEIDRSGRPFDGNLLLVAADGAVTELDDLTYTGAREAVVSPDGRYLAWDTQVRDMATGERLARIPSDAVILEAWVGSGIVYAIAGGEQRIWRPGSAPQPIEGDRLLFPGVSDTAVTEGGRCPRVVRLSGALAVPETDVGCDLGPVLSVSPDGRWVVTATLEVLDLSAGRRDRLAQVWTSSNYQSPAAMTWEDEDTLLLSADVEGAPTAMLLDEGPQAFVVRCDVVTLSCERATDAVPATARDIVELSAYR